MTNLQEILDNFLVHPQKRVLAIKGKWGVGKTFAWRKYVANRREFRETALSYVSLFGAKESADIKRLILEKASLLKAAEYNKILRGVRSTWALAKLLPRASDFAAAAQHLEELLIKRFLVCLDDIERRSPTLQLSSVFGLVSQLKEENNCRIVLIFNEDELNEEDQKDLKIYREKIFDVEFTYAPTVDENAKLIFSDQERFLFVRKVFQSLDIRNIRVMQQVAWNLDVFAPYAAPLTATLRDALLRKVAVLTCLFHAHGDEVNFGGLDHVSFASFVLTKEAEETSEDALLRRAEYEFSESDRFIVDFLQHGSFDTKKFQETLGADDARERQNEIKLRLGLIWQMFNRNFRADESTVVTAFTDFLDQHSSAMNWKELVDVCTLVKELNPALDVEKWKRAAIEDRIPSLELEGVEFFKQHTSDQDLLEKLERRKTDLMRHVSIKELVYKIVDQNGWNPEDLSRLKTYSEAEYVDWIRSESDESLIPYIREFRGMFNPKTEQEDWKAIGVKLEDALKVIARTGPLNRIRIKALLGIDIQAP